jgi:hypothetical protein
MDTSTTSDKTWIGSLLATLAITNAGIVWVALNYLS